MIENLILLLICLPLTWAGTYMVTFPNSLIPGVDLDVRVHVLLASGNVDVTANLQHFVNNSVISSASAVVAQGVPSTVKIQIPERLEPSQYKVSISGKGGVVFNNVSAIRYESNSLVVFIQTDKTRYSGGQEVKYRAILFHPNMLGYKGPVQLTTFDGKGNKIEVTDYPTTQDGIVSGKLILSREPVFGKWKIEVKTPVKTFSKSFDVNDYVVPKFSVTIALSDNIRTTSTSFEVSVKARFTFNADVFGNCTIQIYNKPTTYQYIEYSKKIVGEANFTISMTDVKNKLSTYEEMFVRAIVTDNATALTIIAETQLKMTSDTEAITIQKIGQRDLFIPGLPYHTPIFIGRGNEPLGTSGSIRIKPTVTAVEIRDCMLNFPPYKWLAETTSLLNEFMINFDESGYASLNILTPKHIEKLDLELNYGYTRKTFTMYSVSNEPVTLISSSVDRVHGHVGDKINIETWATSFLSGMINYEMYSRGILLRTETSQILNSNHSKFELELTTDMVPQVYVLVTHLTSMGQLLSDCTTVKVEGSPCKNKVSVKYNTTILEPGKDIEMIVSADPNSTVYILAEDERNRLIGTENDIFLSEVIEEVRKTSHDTNKNRRSESLSNGRNRRNMQSISMQSANQPRHEMQREQHQIRREVHKNEPFSGSGVVILTDISFTGGHLDGTDLLIQRNANLPRICERLMTAIPQYMPSLVALTSLAGGIMYSTDLTSGIMYSIEATESTTTPPGIAVMDILRTRFPETWMWEVHKTDNNGKLTLIKTVPDSITSWVSSVFASNSISGFGISDTKEKITVKKNFFLSMDLPSTLILGEEILVQIIVFSYLSTPQQVFIQVTRSDDPIPIPSATLVNPNEGHSTYIKMTPTHLGEIKINVQAKAGLFTTTATDYLEKTIIVRPRGVHKSTNQQRLVSVNPAGIPFTETMLFTDPPNFVQGTKNIRMRITGNFMIPSVKGLQNLISMPTGCGEQTMVHFAPDVFLTKYLKHTGQLTEDGENKAKSYIVSGYQRELTFQRTDGSYSAWGNKDSGGSTWLTSYVLKSFHQAKEIILVDNVVLSKAVNWLMSKQKTDGSFLESHPVYHSDFFQRSTESGIKLTAFVLISLLELKDVPNVAHQLVSVIEKGKRYLEMSLSKATEAYTLSIACYALAKSNSTFGQSCITQLDGCKHKEGEIEYWTEKSPISKRDTEKQKRQMTRAPGGDIETTAYALLTMTTLGHHAKAFPVVKWLISQRNPQGGFRSTQDTVVSIQALTEYSLVHNQLSVNKNVQFNAYGPGFTHSHVTTQQNYDIMHDVEIPSNLSNIIVQAIGNGIAVVDIVQSFYVSSTGNGNHITVSAVIEKESLNSLTIRSTVSWNGHAPSHMIMVEVELPTGFVPDNDFFSNQNLIRKQETIGRIIALYLDGISTNGQVTVHVKMDRADPVVKNQACHVTAYDYYEPTEQAITFYESGLLKRANICDVCPLCSFCMGSFSQIGIGK